MTIAFEYLSTNGIRLHTALAGSKDGEPVFLLHGFPDARFGWEAQIGPLAEAGFRVIALDQRGYNLSDKSKGVASYRMEPLIPQNPGADARPLGAVGSPYQLRDGPTQRRSVRGWPLGSIQRGQPSLSNTIWLQNMPSKRRVDSAPTVCISIRFSPVGTCLTRPSSVAATTSEQIAQLERRLDAESDQWPKDLHLPEYQERNHSRAYAIDTSFYCPAVPKIPEQDRL